MYRQYDTNVYIVMIHKLYVERFHTLLSEKQQSSVTWKILDTPAQTGVSQARRGYALLWIQCRSMEPTKVILSPMIRQNIAWIAPTQFVLCANTEDQSNIGSMIWSTLRGSLWNGTTLIHSILLRVDCYPKSYTEELCWQLQRAVCKMMNEPTAEEEEDPFEGPLPMTLSKSKCTHRLTVIRIGTDDPASHDYYWGFECRSTTKTLLGDIPLNHEAAEEIVVVPPTTPLPVTTPSILPVSRAYYKLQELWQDYLYAQEPDILQHISRCPTAMDFGAAPGGWTQVLLQHLPISSVVAVDKAQLAPMDRIRQDSSIQRIFHVCSTLEHFHYRSFLDHYSTTTGERPAPDALPPTRFSMLVCDASVQWNNLLPLILRTLHHNQNAITWTRPALIIITLKLPFKTIPSIQRHVSDLQQQVPIFVQNLHSTLYPSSDPSIVSSRYRIIHLMANSDSERTLMIFFQGVSTTS